MSAAPPVLLPVLVAPDDAAPGVLLQDLMGRGASVPALPRVAFVRAGEAERLPADGPDPWLADARKVRTTALANLARLRPRWRDLRDADGAVVALALDGPHAPARVLDRAAVKEAARLLGARELWLAWTGPGRLEAVDAWRAPVAETAARLRARAFGGAPVLVARKGVLVGVLGLDAATLPLPEPADGDPPPAPDLR